MKTKMCCKAFCSNLYRLFLLTAAVAVLGVAANAQTLKADYRFQGDLNSSAAGAPAMTNLTGANGANSFVNDTVDGYPRQSLRFPKDSGVAVDTNGLIPNDAYTVVIMFRFDDLAGYRRVMDATNGQLDNCGAYILDSRFEGESTAASNSILFPNYLQAVIVREASGRVRAYRDGRLKVDVANDQGCFQIHNNNLRFFQDDTQEPGEASAGNVARIRLYDAPMSDVQVRALDRVENAVGGGDQPILFFSDRDGNIEIYSMNADGSNQRRLTNNSSTDSYPDWSKSQQKIVFNSSRDGNSEIYTMDIDGNNPTRLTNDPWVDYSAHWSPDGSKILFSRCEPVSGVCDLWVMNADGTGQTNLTNNSVDDDNAQWSPDGSKIVFASVRDGATYEIYTMDAAGGSVTRLTNNTTSDVTPAFSPDGTQIVFASYRDGVRANIYKMNANGSNQVRVLDNTSEDHLPIWSPDGSKIVFSSYVTTATPTSDAGDEIFTMNADGTGVARLTFNNRLDSVTAWRAPSTFTIGGQVQVGGVGQSGVMMTLSGSQSASTVTDASGNYSFTVASSGSYTVTPSLTGYTFDPASATFNNVSANQTANFTSTLNCSYSVSATHIGLSSSAGNGAIVVTAPAGCQWTASSDSSWLHISSGTPGNGNGTVQITVEQNAGSQRTGTLTVAGQTITVNQTGGHAAAGQPILFISTRNGNNEVYKMDVDGANQQRLTNTPENEFGGWWSPDGRKILYGKVVDSTTRQIWTMSPDGSGQTLVSEAAGNHPEFSWSPDGQKILFTRGTTNVNTRIWVMNADGSNKTQLTDPSNLDHFARWSPNGSRIAFGRCDVNVVCDIYTMNADGSNQTNLTSSDPNDDDNPRWTRDGTKVIFVSDQAATYNVYVVNADGTNRQQLTHVVAPLSLLLGPVSPDGNKINLTGNESAAATSYEIFTANIDGSGLTKLTNNSAYDDFGVWSPDSAALAFVSRRDTPTNEIYTMNADGSGVVRLTFNSATDLVTDWYKQTPGSVSRRALFDFDGDGKTDVSIFRSGASAEWWVLRSSDSSTLGLQFGTTGDITVPADYTGDGKTDIAVYRPSDGAWYMLRSEDNSFYGFPFGASDDIPAPADFDGDGKADAAVYRPSQGAWYILGSQAGFSGVTFGAAEDLPLPGDYDGDGKADVAVFRPSNGGWYVLGSTNGFSGVQFGEATDTPVPADYDGDGKTDVAVFRPSNGAWYILGSQAGFSGVQFGLGTDKPITGDYDGDGKADVAVFRASQGAWYVLGSANGFSGTTFGLSTDQPVPNSYVR